MSWKLDGKRVLITGAARGIGAATAATLAKQGARLALVGLEPELLAEVTSGLQGADQDLHVWFVADVTKQDQVDAAVAGAVQKLGGLDIVLANAGISNIGTVATSPADALVRVVDVNTNGVIRTVSAALPHIIESKGFVQIVASMASFTAGPGLAAYSASKAAAEAFANALRLEVAHLGVDVCSVHPGWIDTDLVRDAESALPSFAELRRKGPGALGSTTNVAECAEAIVDGMERRKRRVFVPKSVALLERGRSIVNSYVGDLPVKQISKTLVPKLEEEVRNHGKHFGETSVGQGK